jgi:hypothetical protein
VRDAPRLSDGIQRSLQPTQGAFFEFIIYSDNFYILPGLSVKREGAVEPVVSVRDRDAFGLVRYESLTPYL